MVGTTRRVWVNEFGLRPQEFLVSTEIRKTRVTFLQLTRAQRTYSGPFDRERRRYAM